MEQDQDSDRLRIMPNEPEREPERQTQDSQPIPEQPKMPEPMTRDDVLELARRLQSGEMTPEELADKVGEEFERRDQELSESRSRTKEAEAVKDKIQEQSDRDPYNPDVYSANGWYRVMADKVAELRRTGKKAFLLALDIDGFGDYNNQYSSHVEGDRGLGIAGGLLKDSFRPSDLVVRLHGDEFVVVVEAEEMEGAVIAADRARIALLDLSDILETTIPLSASVGVIEFPQEIIHTQYSSEKEFKEALIDAYDQADAIQYKGAKHVGKNRVGAFVNEKIVTAWVTENSDRTHTVRYEPSPLAA